MVSKLPHQNFPPFSTSWYLHTESSSQCNIEAIPARRDVKSVSWKSQSFGLSILLPAENLAGFKHILTFSHVFTCLGYFHKEGPSFCNLFQTFKRRGARDLDWNLAELEMFVSEESTIVHAPEWIHSAGCCFSNTQNWWELMDALQNPLWKYGYSTIACYCYSPHI